MVRTHMKLLGPLFPILRVFPTGKGRSVVVIFSVFCGHVTAGNIAAVIGGMTSSVIRVCICV